MQTRKGKIKPSIVAAAVALVAMPGDRPDRAGRERRRPRPARRSKAKKKVLPKQRGIYWGAWIGTQLTGDQPPWDMSAVSHFEGMVGKGLSLLEFAAPFADCSTHPLRLLRRSPPTRCRRSATTARSPSSAGARSRPRSRTTSTSPPSSSPTSPPATTTTTSATSPKAPANGATPSSSASTGR